MIKDFDHMHTCIHTDIWISDTHYEFLDTDQIQITYYLYCFFVPHTKRELSHSRLAKKGGCRILAREDQ
jgi:hypothetical protein